MRTHTLLSRAASIAVCFGILLSGPAMAGESRVIRDVQLTQQAKFQGQVLTPAGKSVSNAVVQLRFRGTPIAAAKTDNQGRFVISNVRAGAHELVTGTVHSPVRLWSYGTAPRGARTGMVVAIDETIVRGQDYCETGCETGCAPSGFGMLDVITLATVGAAVGALVVGIDNNNKLEDLEAAAAANPASP